jgi:glycosyl transferase family 25
MTLKDQPKTFVIALKNHPISENQLSDCLESAKKFNWSIEVFWGIDGRTITESSWNDIRVKPLYHKGSMGKPGTWGCFFSHWHLWNRCVKLNEPIVILEHDAVIEDYWRVFDLKLLTKLHENYSLQKLHKWVDEDSGVCSSSTHAYCISPKAAQKMIKFSQKVGAFAADRMIGDKVLSFEHLGHPSLVSRQNSFSTTETL